MCQLLGMNCNTPTDVSFSFSGFAQRGGRTDHHADGWGIAFFEGRGARVFLDPGAAADSPVAALIRRYPIKSRNVIAHIRKATVGAVTLENCHPFVRELWGRYWVFAHNGDLKDHAPRLHGHFRPVGGTDSGAQLVIEAGMAEMLIADISTKFRDLAALGHSPVLVCAAGIRLPLRRLVQLSVPGLPVLSYTELSASSVTVNALGMIDVVSNLVP